MKKNWWIGLIAVALLAAVGAWWMQSRNSTSTTVERELVEAFVGDIQEVVQASGKLVAPPTVRLPMGLMNGTISAVLVTEGQAVTKGTPLLEVAKDDYQRAVTRAESNVSIQQGNYYRLLVEPSQESIDSADAGIKSATLNLDALRERLQLDVKEGETAKKLEELTLAEQAQVAQAEAQLAQAKAQKAQLTAGADTNQVGIAKQQLEQAKLGLEEAKLTLAKTTLLAPADGTVTKIGVSVGELATGIVVEMVPDGELSAELDVDEIDLGRLSVGLPVRLEIDAFPDTPISGVIDAIAPVATLSQASDVVNYAVAVKLDKPKDSVALRSGMSVNAQITVEEHKGVVLVPNRAISVDRATNTYAVQKVTGTGETQSTEVVTVTIGIRQGANTEVISGVKKGDQLELGNFEVGSAADRRGNGPPISR